MSADFEPLPLVEPSDAGPEDLIALALSGGARSAILDSCGNLPPDARLLIVGFDPFATLDGSAAVDPLAALDQALAEGAMGRTPNGLPAGAAIGALAYDLGRRYEKLPATARVDDPAPDAFLALYDRLLVHDYADGRSWIVSTGLPARGEARVRRARERSEEARDALMRARRVRPLGGRAEAPASNFTRAAYVEAVRRIQEFIAAGDVYQVNLTQRFTAPLAGLAPEEIFRRLRLRNPASFSALVKTPDRTIVSTSPERFLKVDGVVAEMWPIKGTRPRGATPEEDGRLARELAASEKDRAENLMIVDLVRHDLGRVAKFGTVRVDELFGVRAYPTVLHLVSRVSAELREGTGACDVLRAAFPCGSITGAPKIRAMEIIEALEGVRRGVSMGAIGYASFDGSADWNVAIRTMEVSRGVARFNVGGGVVADSDPFQEYEESMWKARAILEVLRAEC
jgi:para-aminobenzoate synthetase component I